MNINLKKVGGAAASIASVLGLIIAWQTLGWPLPASQSSVVEAKREALEQVAGVEQFSKSTREIVLGQEWFRNNAKLQELRGKLARDPDNQDLRLSIQLLEQQQRGIEAQLKELERE